jgi:hypothetical protein
VIGENDFLDLTRVELAAAVDDVVAAAARYRNPIHDVAGADLDGADLIRRQLVVAFVNPAMRTVTLVGNPTPSLAGFLPSAHL